MNSIFIAHATQDDAFVKDLRITLEKSGLPVWVDSRNLRGGQKLAAEVSQAIEQATHFIVVLSPNTMNSPWVRKEIKQAVAVEQQRQADGYRIIPLLLPGVEPSALDLWFEEERLAIFVNPVTLTAALPAIMAALGEKMPDDPQPLAERPAKPVAELLLELKQLQFQSEDGKGKRRAKATATLTYYPADRAAREVKSRDFFLIAPLGPIETGQLQWYLEKYSIWPSGPFVQRAAEVEAKLPQWGKALYDAVFALAQSAQPPLTAWQHAAQAGAERRFSVLVETELPEGTAEKEQLIAREAGNELLSLPWELLHDDRGYLFQGKQAVRVRRRLPNRREQPVRLTELPIRILLVSPRPEQRGTGYINHRASALPLVTAVESLGDLVALTVLTPPTFPALQQALQHAADCDKPIDVVHFDGHGVYDKHYGLGALCFEDPKDLQKTALRATALVDAKEMAEAIRDYRIPVVFLEACQTAKSDKDPTASVAARLLDEGVTSVVAMSHSVLVETARRFVAAFYRELALGARVGQAMLAGQRALKGDTYRGKTMGVGDFHLQDWFVPVLYQEHLDPQLFTALPPKAVQQLQAQQRRLSLGALPEPPLHAFIGRSRELLALERLLFEQPYAVLRGPGGIGKTTLAVELARWLVRTGRFQRTAFVSLEQYTDARGVLDSLGHQLLPAGDKWSVAQYASQQDALQPVERALLDHNTLIVLDNLESVLDSRVDAPAAATAPSSPDSSSPLPDLWALCQTLLQADQATRLLFTSRERLPAPFNHNKRDVPISAFRQEEAIALVSQVMAREGVVPKETDPGTTPQEITDLVEAVNCHARALVLLAQEVSRQGVRTTTENLHQLMTVLDQQHPGERENSLYASVELSLRRLSTETRAQIRGLAMCHGGVQLGVLMDVLDVDKDTAFNIGAELIDVGLAEEKGYGHLRLDPALPVYLRRALDAAAVTPLMEKWAAAMTQLVGFLYKQRFQDTQLAAQLTLLELSNLLALLAWVADQATPAQVVDLAGSIEQLLANLNRPQALAQVVAVREQAAKKLGGWSHAQFSAKDKSIDRLIDKGDLQSAYEAANQLLQRSVAAGEEAYQGAAYDIAMTHFTLGRVLKNGGAAEAALQPLHEAQQRFQSLADADNRSAERMASVAITESGDCLRDLGQLEDAATAYQEAIQRDEKRDAARDVAAGKFQLGTVRKNQQRYDDALDIYTAARKTFEGLGELGSVATAWHQIGMVHRDAKQFEQAEQAYRQSLAIEVQRKNKKGECDSLTELGNLYDDMGRLEDAVTFYQQAADKYIELQDMANEGRVRNNLADTFIKLARYDEARRELQRAIVCGKPYGHAAQPWKTWGVLYELEQATHHPDAAAKARAQAIQCFLDYRRAGGENHSDVAKLCAMVGQAIAEGEISEAEQELARYTHPSWQVFIPKLQAVLNGERDLALAEDSELYYQDVVELRLLLEQV